MNEIEDVLDKIEEELNNSEGVHDWKPTNINHFSGNMGNTLIEVIETEWTISKALDPSKI